MQLNAEDNGNRRFIMVQLPEIGDGKGDGFGYGDGDGNGFGDGFGGTGDGNGDGDGRFGKLDIGFRLFKLDESNLKIWDNTPIPDGNLLELERRMRGMLDIIKDDRSNLDVVYEVMLKLGQGLCEDITELDINGKTVYGVGADVTFMVCLAEHITPEDAEAMAEYAPGRIIFSEQCFDNTTDKSNVKLTLRDRGINIKML